MALSNLYLTTTFSITIVNACIFRNLSMRDNLFKVLLYPTVNEIIFILNVKIIFSVLILELEILFLICNLVGIVEI